jgi:hypothetical protein
MKIPSLIYDMPNEDYHSSEMKKRFVSKSGLDQIAKSPAHFKWFLDNPTEETPALVFGRAFHTMILEPEKVEAEITRLPDSWPTKKECGRSIEDQKEEFRIIHRGKAILTAEQMEMANAMAKSVEEHTAARFLLRKDNGKAEVTALWTDADTNVDCRARFDWLRDDGLIVDLKTTRCAKPEIFEKLAIEHRYHIANQIKAEKAQKKRAPQEHIDPETGEVTEHAGDSSPPVKEVKPTEPKASDLPTFDINAYDLNTAKDVSKASADFVAVLTAHPKEDRPGVFLASSGVMLVEAMHTHGLALDIKKMEALGVKLPGSAEEQPQAGKKLYRKSGEAA